MSESLLRGHHRFLERYARHEREFLRGLAESGQKPSALFIGCSDSRVVPELLTSASPGELFVVRNVANLVPPLPHPDASVGAAIEYACDQLGVPNVIVCGHYGCGGVKAALDGTSALPPSLREWLEPLGRVAARVRAAGLTGEEAWRAAVEESVLTQLDQLVSFPQVERRIDEGKLELHGWVYDLASASLSVYDPDRECFTPGTQLLAAPEGSSEPRP